jgi:hypothetical protein
VHWLIYAIWTAFHWQRLCCEFSGLNFNHFIYKYVLNYNLLAYRHERKEADLLQTLNDAEIDKEEETSTLFRAASLTTTLMDHYMKSICTPFLIAAVSETIHKLMEAKQSCEVIRNA